LKNNNDLSPFWIKENLEKAIKKFKKSESEYIAFKDKNLPYAIGLKRMMIARYMIVTIWSNALKEIDIIEETDGRYI